MKITKVYSASEAIKLLDNEEPEDPYCTKCGQQANNPCIYTGKENWFTGHCIKCDNDNAEFVGNSEQYYEGDDYVDLY